MSGLLGDLRYAVRALGKNRGFTMVAVAVLTLGIGANTAIFSVINAVLLRPLPYGHPDRLAFISLDPRDPTAGIFGDEAALLSRDTAAFEQTAVFYRDSGWSHVTLTGNGEPEAAQGGFVTANFFQVLQVGPILGRALASDDESHRNRVVVLSHRLWTRRFGADANVVGKMLEIDGTASQVIGVMPATFQFPANDVEFWAPITTNRYWGDPAVNVRDPSRSRGFYARWNALGRLRAGASLDAARGQMHAIAAGPVNTDPTSGGRPELFAMPVSVEIGAEARRALLVLLGAVLTVLLIACANIANLVLARGSGRQRELAIRTAIGASRGRLARQLFAESVVLVLLSAAGAVALATFAVPLLVAFGPSNVPRLEQTSVDAPVLAFTGALSLCSALLFGLVPAWRASRTDPAHTLKSGGPGSSSESNRARSLLVVAECALAVVLVSGAGLLIRSLIAVEHVDTGFQADHVVTLRLEMPAGTPAWRSRAVYADALLRLNAAAGVRSAGAIDGLFDLATARSLGFRRIEGREVMERPEAWTPLTWKTVSGNYFAAMGAPLLRGRFFADRDDRSSPLAAIVDQSLAHRYWPGEDPIGHRFKGQDRRGANDEWITVVGVVGDMRREGLERSPTPHVYLWSGQSNDPTPDLVVRTEQDDRSPAASTRIRDIVRSVDPAAILSPAVSLERQISQQLAPRRFQTWLLTLFSLMALALAGVGIYGVMHYAISRRQKEIGIRMALGAQRADVLRMIVLRGMRPALLGLAIGLPAALGLGRILSGLLYGVRASDPPTIAAAILLLSLVALAACLLPALRATRVDPTEALRTE